MKTALITGKILQPDLQPIINNLRRELEKYKIDSFLNAPEDPVQQKFDIAFSVGGDGSFLGAARRLARYGKPIVIVYAGSLGFLPSVLPNALPEGLKLILKENHWIHRMMLSGQSDGNTLLALNEFLFSGEQKGSLSEFIIIINGSAVVRVRADSLIISTPTGSTAYNLSAGGPIVLPDMELLLITPVCSHILGERPLVVGLNNKIEIVNTNTHAQVWGDGQDFITLKKNACFTIDQNPHYVKCQSVTTKEFFQSLSVKLGWNF